MSAYRPGEFEEVDLRKGTTDEREVFAAHPDKHRLRVFDFVKKVFRNYTENHDVDAIPQPSDTWDISKSTGNLEVPFAIRSVPDCVVFCRELELMLEVRKVILEHDSGTWVLKVNYHDLQRASGRGLQMQSCFGTRNRIIETARNGLVLMGLLFLLLLLFNWLFW